MKIWSPLPRSTTLVSPVTSVTPASSQAARIDATIRRRSVSGSPSSRMNAADRNSGRAPPTARSLTVPCTASRPMSPPGKKSGRTTKESVVKAMRGPSRRCLPPRRDGRLVLQRRQHVVAEGGQEDALDQVGRQLAAAAVAEQDLIVPRLRHGTRAEHALSPSLPETQPCADVRPFRHDGAGCGSRRPIPDGGRRRDRRRRPPRRTPSWRPAACAACIACRTRGTRAASSARAGSAR